MTIVKNQTYKVIRKEIYIMSQLFKATDVEGTALVDNHIYVGDVAEVDGVEGFIKLDKFANMFSEDRFDYLDEVDGPDTLVKLVTPATNFTVGKTYNVASAWESDRYTYYLLKNDLGVEDYLKAERFIPVAPAVATPVAQVPATSEFGYVKCVNNHKPVRVGDLKRVKRITEGKVYPLARDWNYSQDFAWITNDDGAVEDYRKARLNRVQAQATQVVWVAIY